MTQTSKTYICGCGAITGEACQGEPVTADRMVVVEYMPEHLRASHEAAGNSGSWPANGSERIAIDRECYRALSFDDDDPWMTVVSADPAKYAESAE